MENYKEKYEQALDNFKKIKAANKDNKELVDFINYEYPELKESDDERIRKDLIGYFEGCGNMTFAHHLVSDIIAWIKKQGEQKPADKVEPKFKVGDWIINSEGMLRHILDVDKTGYQTDNGWLTHDIYDNTYHLWTIQDAKVGDVLAVNDDTIIIFKNLYNGSTFHSFCHIENDIFRISKDDMPDWWSYKGFHPATKEQCDLLFQKMKEAGYEWDDEKKEMKKYPYDYANDYYTIKPYQQ